MELYLHNSVIKIAAEYWFCNKLNHMHMHAFMIMYHHCGYRYYALEFEKFYEIENEFHRIAASL